MYLLQFITENFYDHICRIRNGSAQLNHILTVFYVRERSILKMQELERMEVSISAHTHKNDNQKYDRASLSPSESYFKIILTLIKF